MNVYDSERMADTLAPGGWSEAADAETADLVILNTCHIREKASEKVYSELGRLRVLKGEKAERGEKLIVAVAGCVAQAEGVEIARRAPVVDMVFGPQSYHRLPEIELRLGERPRRQRLARRRDRIPRSRTSSTTSPPRRATRPSPAASPPSSPCRKVATSSAPSASCPTPAASNPRARSPASSPKPSDSPTPVCAR